MAIFYVKQQKSVNPGDAESQKKWYPVPKSTRQVGEREMAVLIADETTLNPKEAEMALAQMSKIAKRMLLEGCTVKLGDWATIHVTLTATGADTEEECTGAKIKRVNPRCIFDKEFKRDLQRAEFKTAKAMEKKTRKPGGEDSSGPGGGSSEPDPGVTE